MKRVALLLTVLFGLTLYRSQSQIVTMELKSFDIYKSSFTLIWKETTSPFDKEDSTFRVYKHEYEVDSSGDIMFIQEIEGTYTPATSTDEVITFP